MYDGLDYLKVIVNEMRQLKVILAMYGISLEPDYDKKYVEPKVNFEQSMT